MSRIGVEVDGPEGATTELLALARAGGGRS